MSEPPSTTTTDQFVYATNDAFLYFVESQSETKVGAANRTATSTVYTPDTIYCATVSVTAIPRAFGEAKE